MDIQKTVKNYYSEVLNSSDDLKTNACCVGGRPPKYLEECIERISDEVKNRFYGCGYPITEAVSACRVLDLGCGTGRDVYIYSQLVGEKGDVIGLDMTDAQLDIAISQKEWHAEKFNQSKSNVTFVKGYIENLNDPLIKSANFDIVVSNCVVNLSFDKAQVLKEIFRVLKEGGEFYFSDVFCDRRLPGIISTDPVLYGECLGGALYYSDFERMAKSIGFTDPRVVSEDIISLNKDIGKLVEGARFVSRTYRLFKLNKLEPSNEYYGQSAIYNGGIFGSESIFKLDEKYSFIKGDLVPVCSNTALMLSESRLSEFFDTFGCPQRHLGEFDLCDKDIATSNSCC